MTKTLTVNIFSPYLIPRAFNQNSKIYMIKCIFQNCDQNKTTKFSTAKVDLEWPGISQKDAQQENYIILPFIILQHTKIPNNIFFYQNTAHRNTFF